jgi:hypothetical protein
MRGYAETAIKEMKEAGEWDSEEERINYLFDCYPPKTPARALILVILRGESPETILINLELKSKKKRDLINAIKEQIKTYFESAAHKNTWMPNVFTLSIRSAD